MSCPGQKAALPNMLIHKLKSVYLRFVVVVAAVFKKKESHV